MMSFNFEIFAQDVRDFIKKYYTHSVDNVVFENIEGALALKIFGAHDSLIEIKDDGDEILCAFFEHHWHVDKGEDYTAEAVLSGVFDVLSGAWSSYVLYCPERLYGGGIAYGRNDQETITQASEMLKNATHIRLKRWGQPFSEYPRDAALD